MKPISKKPLNKNDVSHLIDMALGNKMPWSTLTSLLKDITPYDSKEVIIESLLQALEKLHLKLAKMSSSDFEDELFNNETSNELNEESEAVFNDDFEQLKKATADNSLNTPQDKTKANDYVVMLETVDDDIEVLEVMKKTIHEEENNELDDNKHLSEDELRKRDKDEPVDIENCNSETELLKENGQKQDFVVKIAITKKLFQCTICHKKFKSSGNLNMHVRIHNGEKPFECRTCNMRFTDKSTFTRHEKVHTGEKPYQCKSCSKSFARKFILENHERIHTGEVPYKCRLCNKRFKSNSALNHHKKSHHKTAV